VDKIIAGYLIQHT